VFIFGNLLHAVAEIINMMLTIYLWVIVARALVSWVNPDPYNAVVQFLYKLTEPVLSPIRRLLGSYSIGLDISPLIAILCIYFLQMFLVRTLMDFARQLS
jgi:YggT family protein